MLNPLTPSGYFTYQQLQHWKLHFAGTIYSDVPNYSYYKKPFFPLQRIGRLVWLIEANRVSSEVQN